MKDEASRRQVSRVPFPFLQLNDDALEHIMDHVSVEDACALRLCSKQAAQVATPRALSCRTVRTVPAVQARIESILQRAGAGSSPEFVWLVDLTVVPLFEQQESPAAFVEVLCRLLSKAPGLQTFSCMACYALEGEDFSLVGDIASLRSLQTLSLFWSSKDVSHWLFRRCYARKRGGLNCLVHLSVGELDLPGIDLDLTVQYAQLRTLVVQKLSGKLSNLVHVAPNLTHLEIESIEQAAPSKWKGAQQQVAAFSVLHRWEPLDSVMGRLCDLHRLLPFFKGPIAMRRIVFTDHLVGQEEKCAAEVLSATQPCCLELRGQEYLPIHRILPSVSRCLFYLELCRPNGEYPWLNGLLDITKDLPHLLCLDINVRHEDVPNNFHRFSHYFSCKIPGLRFLILTRQTKTPRPIDPEQTHVSWKHGDMHGVRFVHHESPVENWARGRYCEALRLAHAQRLRAAYRDASFETRFDVEERLFPGPLPGGPGLGAGGAKHLDIPWATMTDED
ncbi:hypothetical protein EIP86_000199 [Pleurotus ostreatoroseus]|nr:hypothetical protein EIP86_000199 [Pleurotus ostreatoroseus]